MFKSVLKYNPNHGKDGRFSSASGGGGQYASFNRFEIEMSKRQVGMVPRQGAADAAVEELVKDPGLRKQLETIGPQKIREELKEYGAWDDNDLADDEANMRRILWIAAGDIQEDKYMKTRKGFSPVFKFNPNHDPKNGRFASSQGGVGRAALLDGSGKLTGPKDVSGDEALAWMRSAEKHGFKTTATTTANGITESMSMKELEEAWVPGGTRTFSVEGVQGGGGGGGKGGGGNLTPSGHRPLSEIARDIRRAWGPKVNYAAKPYLEALSDLTDIKDNYYADSAKSVVAYFLSNATSFRGEEARNLKKELNALLKKSEGYGNLFMKV